MCADGWHWLVRARWLAIRRRAWLWALHVDRSTVIRWEAGDQAPLPYLRPKLARLLGQSPEQLREPIENDSDIQTEDSGASPDIEAAFG